MASTGTQDPKLPSAPVNVQTTTVSQHNIRSRIEVVGTVQAIDQAVIAAKISGTIIDLPVVLGSRVDRGDLLIKLNAEEISARVLQAQAQLAQAQRNLKREKKLLKQQASTPETVKSMGDMLAVARASHHEATSMLSYTTITAPFSGVITCKIANNGDLATPGTPLLHLEDDKRLQVVAAIPETIALQIRQQQKLSIYIPATAATLEGKIAEISPVIDPSTRTSKVKINLGDPTGLRTGMFARVQLPGTDSSTLMIPEQAIVSFGQLEKVFIIHNQKAWLRLVRTGVHTGTMVEVLSGLQAGEQVVITNNRLLINGQPLITN
jgi:RND family efflux transporter MFP subunit